jgi:peptidoglycan/LPS O-acetylase OafA/YrhL
MQCAPRASNALSAANGAETVLDRFPALDGLRGVALLLVLSFHLQIVPKSTAAEKAVFWFTGIGWSGVQLFFVLSGYLITSILLRTRQSPRYYSSFYMRRILRIFPAYYALLIGFYGVNGLREGRIDVPGAVVHALYLKNMPIALFGSIGPPVLAVTWSLAVEEQYYGIWPMVVRAFDIRLLRRMCVVAIALAFGFRCALRSWMHLEFAAYAMMPARTDALAAGSLVALSAFAGSTRTCRLVAMVSLLSGVAAVLVAGWLDGPARFLGPFGMTVGLSGWTLVFGAIMFEVTSSAPTALLAALLGWAPLRAIGRYSYAMYLLHMPVRQALLAIFPAASTPRLVPSMWGTQWIVQSAFYAVAIAATYALAYCSWKIIEGRFLAMKARWTYPPC